ncbi:MAG: acyl-CoA dehydrogenase [Pseudomonadota bacterium]|nr:acyl-CoA dehydrogenase [Pseudomonadota bacterium]
MIGMFWLLFILIICLFLSYKRIEYKTSSAALGATIVIFTLFGPSFFWSMILWLIFLPLLCLNIASLRKEYLTVPIYNSLKNKLPKLSSTEREALEAGGVWWEGEFFSGMPNWDKLLNLKPGKLSKEEQDFLDGPTEELCAMLNDWEINHDLLDLPDKAWKYLKEKKFFSLIIPKKYGGLGFSPLAVSLILSKASSCNSTLTSIMSVPNSLGPAELLLHYGTEEQKNYWLPRLAKSIDIPCFALTSPRAGSDATAIMDHGVICKKKYKGKEVIGINLNWDKRYITLAPIATVLGLAVKLSDPDHLIGNKDDYGITAILVPTNLDGITIGRRHLPMGIPFQNGPTQGKNVFVPIDSIIGGQKMAGKGWKMLVELLSVGRGIALPSNAVGGAQTAIYTTGAYANLRKQFGMSIGKFEGVGEAIARMAGYTYIIKSGSRVTCAAINQGEKPAVPSAILKYHNTELSRIIIKDAIDIHAGKLVILGPKNYLGNRFAGSVVPVTVEGANILTRSLIIFGQGAIRCHPFVLPELNAMTEDDQEKGINSFDKLFFKHIGYSVSNAVRSLIMGITFAKFSFSPRKNSLSSYYRQVNRYSASFALVTDVAMLFLGGDLKRKELLSARLGDVLSYLYFTSMVLKHYEDEGSPKEDLPLVEWSCRFLLYRAQEQLHGFLRNFPNRLIAKILRILVFPRGRSFSSPSDQLGNAIVDLMTTPSESRDRLCSGMFNDEKGYIASLNKTLLLAEEVKPIEKKILQANKKKVLLSETFLDQIKEAEEKGIISSSEKEKMIDFDARMMEVISVDDFDPKELVSKTKNSIEEN